MMHIVASILAADAAGKGLPPYLPLIGIFIILGSLYWMGRRRSLRGQPELRTHRYAEKHNGRLEKQAREDVDELMVRLEEVSREICGKIDTRFARLEQVIAEADQKLAALKAAIRRQDPNGDTPPFPAAIDPTHLEVCRRFGQGQAVVAISRDMGLAPGEVELIVSLERSRKAAEAADAPKLRT
jgi:hypothetical protein